jgi:hypothetical protein
MCFLLGDYNINLFQNENHSLICVFEYFILQLSVSPHLYDHNTFTFKSFSRCSYPERLTNQMTSLSDTLIDMIFLWILWLIQAYIILTFRTTFQFSTSFWQLEIKSNCERFKMLIDDISWENVYNQAYVESAYQTFITSLNCFPSVMPRKRAAEGFWKPWFTISLKTSC